MNKKLKWCQCGRRGYSYRMSMTRRLLVGLIAVACVAAQSDLERRAQEFLDTFDGNATHLMYQYSLASWAYNTDISQENLDKLVSFLVDLKWH